MARVKIWNSTRKEKEKDNNNQVKQSILTQCSAIEFEVLSRAIEM